MSGLSPIADHWIETVADYILEQYRDASNWKAILKSVIDKFTGIEEQIWKLAPILDFKCRVKEERPTGALLDFIAGIKNVERNFGESDAAFYERFGAEVSSDNSGTPDNVIYNASLLSGDAKPQYMDEADCTFFVYTGPKPNHEPVPEDEVFDFDEGDTSCDECADQLYARQVQKLAPCGVLGLVGAAISLGGEEGFEELLADEQGRIILMEADDSTVERELVLADNTGNVIVTPQSAPIRAVVKGTTVPTIPIMIDGGQQVDGVRIKDLPDARDDSGYLVRDSEAGGTTKAGIVGDSGFDSLWENTPADPDDDTNETEGD